MPERNITRFAAIDVAVAPAGAGTTAVNGATLDTAGAESIVFAVHFGAITGGATTSLKLQTGSASDGSDMADVSGTTVAIPDTGSNKVAYSAELHRPAKRYARVVVVRGTQNAVVNGGVAILTRLSLTPTATRANAVDQPNGLVPVVTGV